MKYTCKFLPDYREVAFSMGNVSGYLEIWTLSDDIVLSFGIPLLSKVRVKLSEAGVMYCRMGERHVIWAPR